MACGPKGKCAQAYRKPGKNSVHCNIQTAKGGQWDFCAHQYLCQRTGKWELTAEATVCPLAAPKPEKKAPAKRKQTKKKKEPESVADAYKDFAGPEEE